VSRVLLHNPPLATRPRYTYQLLLGLFDATRERQAQHLGAVLPGSLHGFVSVQVEALDAVMSRHYGRLAHLLLPQTRITQVVVSLLSLGVETRDRFRKHLEFRRPAVLENIVVLPVLVVVVGELYSLAFVEARNAVEYCVIRSANGCAQRSLLVARHELVRELKVLSCFQCSGVSRMTR